MNFNPEKTPKGDRAQLAGKAAQLMILLAGYGSGGVRLKDLAEQSGIPRPTVHRILQELAAYRFVRQLPDKKYALGSALFHLGLAAPQPVADSAQITAIAQKLSDETGDTCYVAVKSFDAVHYLVRTDGGFPIRAQTVAVGERKPYTESYCGLAMLSVQAVEIQNEILKQWEVRHGRRPSEIQTALQQCAEHGFLYGEGLVLQGISGIACPVAADAGPAFAAVSLSAIESRLPPGRAAQIAPKLKAAAAEIGRCFQTVE